MLISERYLSCLETMDGHVGRSLAYTGNVLCLYTHDGEERGCIVFSAITAGTLHPSGDKQLCTVTERFRERQAGNGTGAVGKVILF